MAYCVNCGVELGESEKACPLCNTKVYHPKHRPNPDAAPYPGDHCVSEQKVSRGGVILIITLVFLLPTSIVAMADVSINFKITWSGYVLGAFAFLYLAVVPPLASKKERPVLFIVLDAVCLGLYLLYIEKKTGDIWFSSLALYIIAGITAAVSILLSLARRKTAGTQALCILPVCRRAAAGSHRVENKRHLPAARFCPGLSTRLW